MARDRLLQRPRRPEGEQRRPVGDRRRAQRGRRVLLIHKTDNDLWALPGGGRTSASPSPTTVVREIKEETGIDVEVTGLVGIYTNPRHVMAYDDGEVRQQFSICFRRGCSAASCARAARPGKSRWSTRRDLDELNIHPSMRLRIDHCLRAPQRALHRLIGPPSDAPRSARQRPARSGSAWTDAGCTGPSGS